VLGPCDGQRRYRESRCASCTDWHRIGELRCTSPDPRRAQAGPRSGSKHPRRRPGTEAARPPRSPVLAEQGSRRLTSLTAAQIATVRGSTRTRRTPGTLERELWAAAHTTTMETTRTRRRYMAIARAIGMTLKCNAESSRAGRSRISSRSARPFSIAARQLAEGTPRRDGPRVLEVRDARLQLLEV